MSFIRLFGALFPTLFVLGLAVWAAWIGDAEDARFLILVGVLFLLFVWLEKIYRALKQGHKEREKPDGV